MERLLAWRSVSGVDVPILGVVPWDIAPGGRAHHIVKRTPKRDKARVQDFLSQFAPIEFIIGELSDSTSQQGSAAPLIFLARFRDNVYIFLINMSDSMVALVKPVVFELLKSMYQVPLKWEVHTDTMQWCEASIPPTSGLRLLWEGVVLDLHNFCSDEAEWAHGCLLQRLMRAQFCRPRRHLLCRSLYGLHSCGVMCTPTSVHSCGV